jgi:hypothetical protein
MAWMVVTLPRRRSRGVWEIVSGLNTQLELFDSTHPLTAGIAFSNFCGIAFFRPSANE